MSRLSSLSVSEPLMSRALTPAAPAPTARNVAMAIVVLIMVFLRYRVDVFVRETLPERTPLALPLNKDRTNDAYLGATCIGAKSGDSERVGSELHASAFRVSEKSLRIPNDRVATISGSTGRRLRCSLASRTSGAARRC